MDSVTVSYLFNTLFFIVSATLIIVMVPGFAMLEAGLVRTKNVVSTLTVNVMIYAIASTVFLLWGFSLMFGNGGLFFSGVESKNVSIYAFFLFQMAFVGKTINIVSGGVSERTLLVPLILFSILMAGLIYPLVGHWTWGGGFLKELHDLAGSTVIHSVGGWAVLAAIIILGARKGKYTKDGRVRPVLASNIPLVVLGALLLWIGWFGFNGGSVLDFSSKDNADLVAKVIVNTNTAGLLGALSATALTYYEYRKLDITMILNGALGGLVSITAGADLFNLWEPMIIGALGGILVVLSVPFLDKFRLDDPVGAVSVHLICGIWGTLALPLFGKTAWLPQLTAIGVVAIFSFGVSYLFFFIVNKYSSIRANEEDEYNGLDLSECGIEGYPEFVKNV